MWVYVQRTGELLHDGILVGRGYSGHAQGLNNPDMQMVPDVGPIPAGAWAICGPPMQTSEHGPYVLRLEPEPGCLVFGRAGFLMHGDEVENPGMELASHGCIVVSRVVRSRVWQSGDYSLEVLADPPQLKITPEGEQTT
jgi:Protein of unknown function (DUF2778)